MRSKGTYIQVRNKELGILEKKGKSLKYSSFSLIETTKEGLQSKLKAIRKNGSSEALLVFPREEILAQDFEVSSVAGALQGALYEKLGKSFPCNIEDLSYGVRVLDELGGQLKGTWVATTNEKLKEYIEPIEGAGFSLVDIVSSDEMLLNYFEPKIAQTKRALLVNVQGAVAECLFVEDGKIRFSKVLRTDEEDLVRDLGLLTLDYEGYEKVLVTGAPSQPFLEALRSQFQVSVENIPLPRDEKETEIPAPLYGAALCDGRKYISLLPAEKKLQKREKEKKRRYVLLAVSVGALFLATSFAFLCHHAALEWRLKAIEAKINGLGPETTQLKKMQQTLLLAKENSFRNHETLGLLRDISTKLPSTITLTKLSLDGAQLLMQGRSIDNGGVADAIALLKGLGTFENPKLEYSLEKRMDTEHFYEFSITAKRGSNDRS